MLLQRLVAVGAQAAGGQQADKVKADLAAKPDDGEWNQKEHCDDRDHGRTTDDQPPGPGPEAGASRLGVPLRV